VSRLRHPDAGSTSSQDSRLARDEEEALWVLEKEKHRKKVGRREQKAEAERQKITLPKLNFLEKEWTET